LRSKIEITFYTKSNCPLCEKAEEIIEEMKEIYSLYVNRIDITKDMMIDERYKHRIPVIKFSQERELSGRIEKGELRSRIRRAQKRGEKS